MTAKKKAAKPSPRRTAAKGKKPPASAPRTAKKPAPRRRSDKPTKVERPQLAKKALPAPAPRRRGDKPTKLERPQPATLVRKKTATPAVQVVDGWIDAGKGYAITLEGDKLVCRSPKGARLASVPKEIRDSDAAEQLTSLKDWLAQHARECGASVETWMLRSLPVPRATLERVWDDPAWRTPLENAVVFAAPGGVPDYGRGGFFRGVDPKKGVGVVDLDGETTWLLDADQIVIPHPILIPELDAWRELATQLAIAQGISQLLRETHDRPADLAPGAAGISRFADGKFAMLMHVLGKARGLGYRVRGGYAVCAVWEAGEVTEARYWIGADSPDSETYTGDLAWVDGKEHVKKVTEVGAVAYSEGVRMASAIYAGRVVDKDAAS